MRNVLIVGVDGTIGAALAAACGARGDEVIGTTRRPCSTGPGTRINLDLAVSDAQWPALPPVDTAVICAAMPRFADCRAQPDMARRINVEAPYLLGQRLVARGTRVILLSTGAVFDGSAPRMPADHPRRPASVYGALKAAAEDAILALGGAASVLRLTKVLTPDMPLINGWIETLRGGGRVEAFDDLFFCPLPLDDVVNAVLAVMDDGSGGIYQVSGAADIAYADAARHLATRLGADQGRVTVTCAADRGIPVADAPRHTSLDTCRLTALTGWVPPSPFAVIDQTFVEPLTAGGKTPARQP